MKSSLAAGVQRSARSWLAGWVKRLPGVRDVVAQRDALLNAHRFAPPGHFNSPIPDIAQVRADAARIFKRPDRSIAGVDLREQAQLALLHSLQPFYDDMPFKAQAVPGLRYRLDNPAYAYADGIFLHAMIRHARPRRIVEVGSGWSSCMTLDTNEHFFGNAIETVFIEPYPRLLQSLLTEADRQRVRILPQRLQDVPLEEFAALQANDILFIDSTHVSKVFSDVNVLFFDVLPLLAPGVFVHLHDVFYPFEYPQDWILEGRAWNEAYLLRAFLQFNHAFRIVLMNTFLTQMHRAHFKQHMPLCLLNTGGSIWLQRV